MVDTLKCLPIVSIVTTSSHRPDHRGKNITLPIFLSIGDRSQESITQNATHWIGRCPGDPHRSVKMATGASRLYRKSAAHEISRYHSLNVDMSPAIRIKAQQFQKSPDKDRSKMSTSRATVTSMSIGSDVDGVQSILSCTSSKNSRSRIGRVRSIHPSSNNSTIQISRTKR